MMKKLIIGIQGATLTEEEQQLLSKSYVGGVLLLGRNMQDIHSTKQLIAGIQEIRHNNVADDTHSPFYITADFECTSVWRAKTPATKTSWLSTEPKSSLYALGESYKQASEDEKHALLQEWEEYAHTLGKELLSLGINLNLAPVVDSHHEESPIIARYGRSFSEDLDVIEDIARAFLTGYKKAGLITHLKHFPDHGFSSEDSHTHSAVDNRDKETLLKHTDIYHNLVKEGLVSTIMMAHVTYPNVDRDFIASRSPLWHNILHEKVGFTGLVLSDCMTMRGSGDTNMIDKIHEAYEAGTHYVILAGDIPLCHELDAYFSTYTDVDTPSSCLRV